MPASANTKVSRERKPFPPSCFYTPTAIRLYPNGCMLISNLKRTSEQAIAQTAGGYSGNHRQVLPHRGRQVRPLCDRVGL